MTNLGGDDIPATGLTGFLACCDLPWAHRFSRSLVTQQGATTYSEGSGVAIDSAGNVCVTGYYGEESGGQVALEFVAALAPLHRNLVQRGPGAPAQEGRLVGPRERRRGEPPARQGPDLSLPTAPGSSSPTPCRAWARSYEGSRSH